jgi:hypothetical protein
MMAQGEDDLRRYIAEALDRLTVRDVRVETHHVVTRGEDLPEVTITIRGWVWTPGSPSC